jgi:hypothetical protein
MGVRDLLKLPESGPTDDMRRAGDMAAMRAAQKSRDEITKMGSEVGLSSEPVVRAKFKIEVLFGKDRTMHGPNTVVVKLWESGRRLNGGGDDLAFWCMNENGTEGCGKIITSNYIKGGVAMCPHCQRAINADLLVDGRVGSWSTKNLAVVLEQLFRELESNADIYLKYHRLDARYLAMEKAKGPEVAKRLKGMHIYPLKNILRDTAHGASLSGRIHAFLTS